MTLAILSKNADLARTAERIRWGVAGDAEVFSLKPEDFVAIRSDAELHVRTSVELLEERAGDGQGARERTFIASDETPDRYGDIIRVAGWDFANFERNPVALWAHNDANPPIGNVVKMQKTRRGGKPVLLESIDYFAADVNPMSETVLRLIDAGGLRAVSVGFIPHKTNRPETPEQRLEMGLGTWGVEFTQVEQVELSNCSIPANPNALLSKALVPMVRDMEASGQLDKHAASVFYAEAEKLADTERRIFALGAPGGNGQPAETGASGRSAAAPPAPVVVPLRQLQTNIKLGETEARIMARPALGGSADEDDDLDEPDLAELDPAGDATAAEAAELVAQSRAAAAGAQGAPGGAQGEAPAAAAPAPTTTLEQRLAALETAHAALRAEHDKTRATLAVSIESIGGLLQFLEHQTTSGSDRQTSGEGTTKDAGAQEELSESYLTQVFVEGFREGIPT
jgi:hypothetical protein